jgi:hypothetical protein
LGEVTNGNVIQSVYQQIREVFIHARSRALQAVNAEMVLCYWEIEQLIVEEEQQGEDRAEYGKRLIQDLSIKLKEKFGKGIDKSKLLNIQVFYLA